MGLSNKIEFNYSISDIDYRNLNINLDFSVYNNSEVTVYFSRRNTPFDNYLDNCFEILFNNDSVLRFDGYYVKRFDENADDIITLKPKEKLSTRINISDSYNFSLIGNYTISYKVKNFKYYINIHSFFKYKEQCHSFELINPSASFQFTQKSLLFTTIGERFRILNKDFILTDRIQFINSNDEQKHKIIDLIDEIIHFFNHTFQLNQDKLFIKWFGEKFDENLEKVKNNFLFIFDKVETKNVSFIIDNNLKSNQNDWYAVTYYNSNSITLFPPFWNKSMDKGFNSKLGILIHEFSHMACESNDNSTSVCDSLGLAKHNPDEAITSANNYEYYVEDLLWSPKLNDPCDFS